MRTLTTLGLMALVSLGISAPAMCVVHNSTDSQQADYARARAETWRPIFGLRVQSLPGLYTHVFAIKDDGGKSVRVQDEERQYAQGEGGDG